jgi:hypothetical protein
MVADWKELGLVDGGGEEQWSQQIKEKLGLSVDELKSAISKWMETHAEELSLTFLTVAPYGDYGKMMEDNDSMAEFFRKEASKLEHWKLSGGKTEGENMFQFCFDCQAVDEGESLRGYVYVSKLGKIRHVFAQNME